MLWIHWFAQDSICPGQQVKVKVGDQQGAVGQVYDVNGLEATIVLDITGDGPMSLILVCNLAPFYKISDHVKN